MKPSLWPSQNNPVIVAALVAGLVVSNIWWYNAMQDRTIRKLHLETVTLQETVTQLDLRVRELHVFQQQVHRDKAILEENTLLRRDLGMLEEENRLLRSAIILSHGPRDNNKVGLTFDDGASRENVERALDHLQDLGVKATFFPMGAWVETVPEVWQRAVAEGHELGNHTYSHSFLTGLKEEEIRQELARWQGVVEETLGYKYPTRYFRPPGMAGYTGSNSRQELYQDIIASKGMITVLWDIEVVYALRHEKPTAARVAQHVIRQAKPGSIILLHCGLTDIEALPTMVWGLRTKGLEPVTLSELLGGQPIRASTGDS